MGVPIVQRAEVAGEDDFGDAFRVITQVGDGYKPPVRGIPKPGGGRSTADFGVWLLRQGRAVRTVKSYARTLERFADWLKQERRGTVRGAKWKDVRDYAETLPYTYASRTALKSALSAYWKFLGRPECPTWAVRCPKAPRRIAKPLTREQLSAAFAASKELGDHVWALCACAYYLGLRREDLAKLRWTQFRRDGSLHVVGKGGIERFIPLTAAVVDAVEKLPRESEYLFPGRWGGHVHPGTVSLWINRVAEASGVNVWPHRFRHTSATNGYQATKDLFAVQQFLGHAKPSTTRGYVEVAWTDVQAVADAL